MNNFFKALIIVCCAGISLSILGSYALSVEKQADPVLAVVNGVPITQSQLKPLIAHYRERSKNDTVSKDAILKILQGAITRRLILQQKESDDIRKEEKVVRQVKEFEDKVVVSAFLTRYVGKHLTVTDEQIKAFYQQNLHQFASPPKVKARHILLRTRKEAEQVLAKLRAGEDFAKLAKNYSIDLPKALEGGTMGIVEKGKALPEVERALFILNVGEISDIVETRFGFHILTVDEIIATQYKPLDEVSESIKKAITLQKEAEAFDEMYAKLAKKAKIEVFEDRVKEAK